MPATAIQGRFRRRGRRLSWRTAGLLLGFLVTVHVPAPMSRAADAPEPDADPTRTRMREIFTSMQFLLPLAVRGGFDDPGVREKLTRALESLAADAELLARHAGEEDPARRFLGRSLAADARNALERFREGRSDSAAFLVQQASENCVACHTKLQSPGDSPITEKFVDESALAALRPEERARLLLATRQFDEALTTLETLFQTTEMHPSAMLGPLTDYLVTAIRVKGDYDRPVPVLERFARRPDLWLQLRRDVEHWIQDLRTLRPLAESPPDLATPRRLVEEARSLDPFGSDQRPLVRFIIASSLLHRWLADPTHSAGEQAEAFTLLGISELRIDDTFWLSQADFYLETAIRRAPGTPTAMRAYELLEAATITSYTGAAGVDLPESVRVRLAELRKLAEPR
ncbi:hypothetical protein KJ059_09525 [Myxococcota bacterium]|nr:hypothetical protein [Myxococcota bacterium]MCZ7619395.1 hypothetical protein [Myxococcota bacterium]